MASSRQRRAERPPRRGAGYLLRPYDRGSYLVENIEGGNAYVVDLEAHPWICTCADFLCRKERVGGSCKHIAMVWDAVLRGKLPPARAPGSPVDPLWSSEWR